MNDTTKYSDVLASINNNERVVITTFFVSPTWDDEEDEDGSRFENTIQNIINDALARFAQEGVEARGACSTVSTRRVKGNAKRLMIKIVDKEE